MKKWELMVTYGTLMRGNHNDHFMEDAKLIGEGQFKGDLYCLGGFPAVMPGEGIVVGEVYRVPVEAIPNIDGLEGYDARTDSGMYLKRKVIVHVGDETIEALVYIWNRGLPRSAVKWQSGERWEYRR